MKKFLCRSMYTMACLGALSISGSETAWGGSHGSSGGSHGSNGGSHGSSGGSHGSNGGSHGGAKKGFSLFNHGSKGSNGGSHGSNGGSHGSSGGSHGSSGGSHGSSGGSHGSSGGSHGSSGGSHGYGYPGMAAPQVSPQSQMAYLNVTVPADAKVYLQDQLMTLSGTNRRYVTPVIAEGDRFVSILKVEIEQDGRMLSKTTEVFADPGQEVDITVSFDEQNSNELVALVVKPATDR